LARRRDDPSDRDITVRGLALVRLTPDLDGLARVAAARGLIGRGGDFGYALHAALAAALGNMAPKPFLLRADIRRPEVLGYTGADPAEFKELARLPPVEDADLVEALRLTEVEVRTLPVHWVPGCRLDFETRIRPVIRTRPEGRAGRTSERDAFLEAIDPDEPPPTDFTSLRVWPTRERIYEAWLSRELARGGAAQLEAAKMIAFKRTRVLRRPTQPGTGRARVESEGPDAILRGRLRIEDGAGFTALLGRGVGRHRAFGFGMLLLTPPGRLMEGR
jgi:CRISPR system Cascade subunit CasE